jgi:Tat protein secretion system quality control protein TatD with DNase activity
LNDYSNLRYTNEKLAEFWGISAEDCAKITAENAKRIFGL